jgi:hypothetical protein
MKKHILYHLTYHHLIHLISKNGLIPHAPKMDMDSKVDECGVYLFDSKEDADNALLNWFADRIEELEEEAGHEFETVLISVDVTGLNVKQTEGFECEWVCYDAISPDRILKIEEFEGLYV